MDLVVFGVSHKTASAAIRDEVQVHAEEMAEFYATIREHQGLVRELVILSTCNRTEFYGFAQSRTDADRVLRETMERVKSVDHLNNGKYTYSWVGRETVRHLFRVASGMDSLMVGESQILGQVRDSFDQADKNRSVGALLTRLFNAAVHVGKRARTETEIGKGTVSVAHAAVELALKVIDRLERYSVLVVGAGDTGSLAARHFAEAGPKRLTIVNRSQEKAVELARELEGRMVSKDIAYITGDAKVTSAFAHTFAIDTVLPLKEKDIQKWIRQEGIGTLEIKKRGVDIDPAAFRNKLRLEGEKQATLILTRVDGARSAIMAHRIS